MRQGGDPFLKINLINLISKISKLIDEWRCFEGFDRIEQFIAHEKKEKEKEMSLCKITT